MAYASIIMFKAFDTSRRHCLYSLHTTQCSVSVSRLCRRYDYIGIDGVNIYISLWWPIVFEYIVCTHKILYNKQNHLQMWFPFGSAVSHSFAAPKHTTYIVLGEREKEK